MVGEQFMIMDHCRNNTVTGKLKSWRKKPVTVTICPPHTPYARASPVTGRLPVAQIIQLWQEQRST